MQPVFRGHCGIPRRGGGGKASWTPNRMGLPSWVVSPFFFWFRNRTNPKPGRPFFLDQHTMPRNKSSGGFVASIIYICPVDSSSENAKRVQHHATIGGIVASKLGLSEIRDPHTHHFGFPFWLVSLYLACAQSGMSLPVFGTEPEEGNHRGWFFSGAFCLSFTGDRTSK